MRRAWFVIVAGVVGATAGWGVYTAWFSAPYAFLTLDTLLVPLGIVVGLVFYAAGSQRQARLGESGPGPQWFWHLLVSSIAGASAGWVGLLAWDAGPNLHRGEVLWAVVGTVCGLAVYAASARRIAQSRPIESRSRVWARWLLPRQDDPSAPVKSEWYLMVSAAAGATAGCAAYMGWVFTGSIATQSHEQRAAIIGGVIGLLSVYRALSKRATTERTT